MNPGRKLDELVAEKVIGLKEDSAHVLRDIRGGHKLVENLKPYSTSIEAAWDVVEKNEMLFRLYFDYISGGWVANFFGAATFYEMQADTAPHAICLAALKAVGVKV